jgi:hypothetical protein
LGYFGLTLIVDFSEVCMRGKKKYIVGVVVLLIALICRAFDFDAKRVLLGI